MSRNIITKRDIKLMEASASAAANVGGVGVRAQTSKQQPDSYETKLMKFIPGEIVSFYVALDAVVKTSTHGAGETQEAYWFIFIVCLIGTPLYLWKVGKAHKALQLFISTFAFAVWIFALGGPFESIDWYQSHKLYPALTLPIFTFFVAMIDP